MMPAQPLPPSTIEAGLLAAVVSVTELLAIASAAIEPQDFAVWGGVAKWQREHAQSYGTLPSPDQLKGRWPDWQPPAGEFRYWLEEMRRLVLARKAQAVLHDALRAVEKEPDRALGEVMGQLAQLRAAGNQHVGNSDADAPNRFALYEKRAALYEETGGDYLIGIPTGMPTLDDTHIGWVPSEFVGFYARPTTGKTWMLVREGAVAWTHGYKVLMISPEMSNHQNELRQDVFKARAMGIELSHQGIFIGDPSQRYEYQRYTEAVKGEGRWWTYDTWNGRAFSVADVRMLAEQHEPDMVLIDGLALLRSEGRRDKPGWERMDENCEALKAFATAADLVIMASHQSVNTRRGQRGERDAAGGRGDDWVMPSLNDAAGGDALVRNCSSVFTMCPDKELANLRWYSVRKTRERYIKDWHPRMALRWEVDRGFIEDLGQYGENMGAIRSALVGAA